MNRKFRNSLTAVFAFTTIIAFGNSDHDVAFVSSAAADCGASAGQGVDWSGCRKRNLIMSDFNFSGSDFSRADLSSSDLRSTNISGTSFSKTNLVRASLKGAKATKADFSNVIASRTDFSKADFEGSTFSKAETNRANFSESNLASVDMSKAEFARANFGGANLSGVNFDLSNLARADLRGATFDVAPSFESSFMFQTRVEGLDLSGAKGLMQAQIALACGDAETKLPSGLETPSEWPCKEIDD
jgi:uncharacterized protein YjbI with pentapeptide repeats